jgi:hypothetical protein
LDQIEYVNKATPGPQLIVIPGEIKNASAAFNEHFKSGSIADFAELELGKANFKALGRSDTGPALKQLQSAYALGDLDAAHRALETGQLKATRYILRFDILKAERVPSKPSSFNGATATRAVRTFIPGPGSTEGGSARAAPAAAVAGTEDTSSTDGTWTIGMRYRIIDAETAKQIASSYIEDRIEVGPKSTSVASSGSAQGVTLDSVVQHLIQECVHEIDSEHK